MTIVSPSISQVSLIINNDKYVAYTLDENRKIAYFIKKSELVDTCNKIVENQELMINNQSLIIQNQINKEYIYTNQIQLKDSIINIATISIDELSEINTRLSKQVKVTKPLIIGSISLNILLIILML